MESQNFYFLVHGSPVSFIQDCKTSSLVAFYIATEPKLVYLLVYMVCTASDKQNSRTFQGLRDQLQYIGGGGGRADTNRGWVTNFYAVISPIHSMLSEGYIIIISW